MSPRQSFIVHDFILDLQRSPLPISLQTLDIPKIRLQDDRRININSMNNSHRTFRIRSSKHSQVATHIVFANIHIVCVINHRFSCRVCVLFFFFTSAAEHSLGRCLLYCAKNSYFSIFLVFILFVVHLTVLLIWRSTHTHIRTLVWRLPTFEREKKS